MSKNKTMAEALLQYQDRGVYPFHMPGHKQNPQYFPPDFLSLDITEIPGMDCLSHPHGIIQDAQDRMAAMWGAEHSFLLINGASGGLVAAILTAAGDGDEIILARNCHQSVYNGLALSGAKPVYIQPQRTDQGIAGGILPETVADALARYPGANAVVITSPTYEGIVSDISAIAAIVHQKGKLLIVDEAHGAHFAFSDIFPRAALACGADIVVQSLHKTLPALTQTAILHTQGSLLPLARLCTTLAMLQSSSPSYILMACAHHGLEKLWEDQDAFKRYGHMLLDFRRKARQFRSIYLLDEHWQKVNNLYDMDKGKLVLAIRSGSLTGKELEEALASRYGVQLEMSRPGYAVAMTSPCDRQEGFDKLFRGLSELDAMMATASGQSGKAPEPPSIIPPMALTPREAIFRKNTVRVPAAKAIGQVSAAFAIPYPPGIPLLVPGEEITKDIVETLCYYRRHGVDIIGQDALRRDREQADERDYLAILA